jgi:16S rRNA processing protein RimM
MKKQDPFDAHFYLGKVIKTHGFDGKVTAFLDTDDPEFYHDQQMVFLNMAGNLVPFFIESIKILNNKATIVFQEVHDLEGAELLVNKEMYLPLSELPELTGNKFYFHEVIGFTVIDTAFGEIGIINEVLDYPNQAVLQIMREGKEVLIPISDEVINKVDRKTKAIEVTSPEGLLDIYL